MLGNRAINLSAGEDQITRSARVLNYMKDSVQIAGASLLEKSFYLIKDKLSSFLTETVRFDSYIGNAVYKWAKVHCKPIPLVSKYNKEVTAINVYLKDTPEPKLVGFETSYSNEDVYMIYEGNVIFIRNIGAIEVSFLRGTVNRNKLIQEVIEAHRGILSSDSKRFKVTRHSDNDDDEEDEHRGPSNPDLSDGQVIGELGGVLDINDSYDTLSGMYQNESVKLLLEDAKNWKDNAAWYKKKRVPWRRGWLLYGQPGNGKSTICKAVAQKLDIPISIFDIGDLSDRDFIHYWNAAKRNSPVMILIEDIDAVFKGRTNVKDPEDGLSFNTLLNCISGVGNNDGVLLVITTNDPESIDPALGAPVAGSTISTRPGRLDRAIEAKGPDLEAKKWLITKLLDQYDEKILEGTEGFSYSQFVEKCRGEAFRLAMLELQ